MQEVCHAIFYLVRNGCHKQRYAWILEVVKRTDDQPGFVVLPKRWLVERTFSWLGHFRRLNQDYEYLPTRSEAKIYAAMVHLMLRRLAPPDSAANA